MLARCVLRRGPHTIHMGIYTTTILYHGRMLSPVGYQRLETLTTKGYISKVCQARWVLHAPGKCLTLGSLDPVIEDHEKVAGFVKQDEIDNLLSRHPKLNAEWSSATSAQIRDLNALVRAAADDETAQVTYASSNGAAWMAIRTIRH